MAAAEPLAVGDPPVCTYSAYYNDDSTDTFGGDYAGVMSDYVLEGGGIRSAADLVITVNSCDSQQIPTAFLILGTRPGAVTPTVQCYHRLTKFQPRMV